MKSETEQSIKAVLDTNVLVSAICFPGGSPDLVFKAAIRKKYKLIISHFIFSEFVRVLNEQLLLSEEDTKKASELVKSTACEIIKPFNVPTVITVKPTDNHILACAIEAEADYLVSGDTKHIQPLGWIGKTKIVSPAEFLRLLAERH